MKTKLYTEEQLLEICKSVAEKAIGTNLDEDWIKECCDRYGYSKITIDKTYISSHVEDDNIDIIELKIKKLIPYVSNK